MEEEKIEEEILIHESFYAKLSNNCNVYEVTVQQTLNPIMLLFYKVMVNGSYQMIYLNARILLKGLNLTILENTLKIIDQFFTKEKLIYIRINIEDAKLDEDKATLEKLEDDLYRYWYHERKSLWNIYLCYSITFEGIINNLDDSKIYSLVRSLNEGRVSELPPSFLMETLLNPKKLVKRDLTSLQKLGEEDVHWGYLFSTLQYTNREELDLVYLSGRPKTTMKTMKEFVGESLTQEKLSYTKEDVYFINKVFGLKKNEFFYVPVSRYGVGLSGLYYTEIHAESCGTFYFFEPDSTNFLKVKKFVDFNTKLHAAITLHNILQSKKNKTEEEKKLIDKIWEKIYLVAQEIWLIIINDKMWLNIRGIKEEEKEEEKEKLLDQFSNYSTEDFLKYYFPAIIQFTSGRRLKYCSINPQSLYNTKKNAYETDFFAVEDELDDILCAVALHLNYDIIILKNMAGKHRTVVEILDTRNRIESFSSIIIGEKIEEETRKRKEITYLLSNDIVGTDLTSFYSLKSFFPNDDCYLHIIDSQDKSSKKKSCIIRVSNKHLFFDLQTVLESFLSNSYPTIDLCLQNIGVFSKTYDILPQKLHCD